MDSRFFSDENKRISKNLAIALKNDALYIQKTNTQSSLPTIINNLVALLQRSPNDFIAMQQSLEYLLQRLTVEDDEGNKKSFGEYLNLCITPKDHLFYNPIPANDCADLEKLFNALLQAYHPISQRWKYSYPTNSDGEILTPDIAGWQTSLINVTFTDEPEKSLGDFKRDVTINGAHYNLKTDNKIISHDIDNFCNQLHESEINKALLSAWMKKCGGQTSDGFMAAIFLENHITSNENIRFGQCQNNTLDWHINDNQLTCTISIDVLTINSDDSNYNYCTYYKPNNDSFILANKNTDELEDIFSKANNKQLDPLITINAEVVLEIANDESNKPFVKPKLKFLELDCKSSICLTHGAKLFLQDPKYNETHINKLMAAVKQSPQHRM